jgi:hypothetical protein
MQAVRVPAAVKPGGGAAQDHRRHQGAEDQPGGGH